MFADSLFIRKLFVYLHCEPLRYRKDTATSHTMK